MGSNYNTKALSSGVVAIAFIIGCAVLEIWLVGKHGGILWWLFLIVLSFPAGAKLMWRAL